MDQIFDRFERLFKSWVAQDPDRKDADGSDRPGRLRRSGDPDLDAAMSELDDFLDSDRGAAEQRQRERESQAREAREKIKTAFRPGGPDPRLVAAYEYLALPYAAPFDQVKARYKKLLMKHHPDRHSSDAENLKKATETSTKINQAFHIIETWTTTGKIPD